MKNTNSNMNKGVISQNEKEEETLVGQNKTNETETREDDTSEMLESNNEKAVSLKDKLKTDEEFRRKFIIWICFCLSFVVLGINLAQGGPTLLDLKLISGCSIEEAALFFTAVSAGYLVASFVISITFERFDKFLHIAFGNFGITIVAGAIPWSFYYGIMLTLHFVKGFMCGIAELATSTFLIHLMGQEVRTYMQILHFSFTIGGILSPIASAPFLTQVNDTDRYNEMNQNSTYSSLLYLTKNDGNFTTFQIPGLIRTDSSSLISEVYKAYSITAGLSFLSVIPFLYMFFKFRRQSITSSSKKNTNENNDTLPLRIKIPVLTNLLAISYICFSIEDTVAGFTATYAVKHFGFTKQMASYASSVYWASFSVGSFSGIFIAPLFQISKLLLFYSFMSCVSLVCLVVTSVYHVDAGIWIHAGLSGFFMSLNWPLLFAWTEEEFLHVTARVTAMITTTASIGVIVSPIITGVLLEHNTIYYSYFLLTMSVILFSLLCIGKMLSVKAKKFRKPTEIELKVNDK